MTRGNGTAKYFVDIGDLSFAALGGRMAFNRAHEVLGLISAVQSENRPGQCCGKGANNDEGR